MTEAVILDCGSGFTKVGHSGGKSPSTVLPTVVGRPKGARNTRGHRGPVGDIALSRDNRMMDIVYPVEHGVITDWEAMENVWEYVILNHMDTPIEETPLLMLETPMNSKKSRERIIETMFETYKAPFVYLGLKPVLSLYAHGDTSGCVLQSGDGVTHTLCVEDGYAMSGTIVKSHICGRAGTIYLKNALMVRSPQAAFADNRVRQLKERCGAISAKGYDNEPSDITTSFALQLKERCGAISAKGYGNEPSDITTSFALPDGQRFEVGKERFSVAEANFNPACIDSPGESFTQCVLDAIKNCRADGMKKKMYENIVLSGGNTMYRNTEKRLVSSLNEALEGRGVTVNVVAQPNRKHFAWMGGSIISSLSTFRDMWITAAEYKDKGSSIVFQKCPYYSTK